MVVVERSVATFLHLPRTFNHQLVPPVFFRIGAAVVSLRLCFPPPSPIHNRCSYNWRLAPVQITEARLDFNLTLKFTWNGNFLYSTMCNTPRSRKVIIIIISWMDENFEIQSDLNGFIARCWSRIWQGVSDVRTCLSVSRCQLWRTCSTNGFKSMIRFIRRRRNIRGWLSRQRHNKCVPAVLCTSLRSEIVQMEANWSVILSETTFRSNVAAEFPSLLSRWKLRSYDLWLTIDFYHE